MFGVSVPPILLAISNRTPIFPLPLSLPVKTWLGNIWVRAYNSYGTAMTSLKVCVGLPCQSTPVAYDPYSLTDVDKKSWSWKYILEIVPLGLIPPRTPTTFEPAGTISRVEMSQFLYNTYRYLKGSDAPIVSVPFTDISNLSQNQRNIIARVYGLGLTAGTSATTFSPDMLVDRAQTAVFLVKLYRLITNIDPPLVAIPFTDLTDPEIAYSQNWVPKIYGLKITAGISATEYGPKLKVTREQMAAFISNTLKVISNYPSPTPTSIPTSTPTPTLVPKIPYPTSEPACIQKGPTVAFSPSDQSQTAGSTLNYTYSITNNDYPSCPPVVISSFGSHNLPIGWNVTFSPTQLTLNPGQKAIVTASYTSNKASIPGYYYVYIDPFSTSPEYSYNLIGKYAKYTVVSNLPSTTAPASTPPPPILDTLPQTPPAPSVTQENTPNAIPATITPQETPVPVNIFTQTIEIVKNTLKQIVDFFTPAR